MFSLDYSETQGQIRDMARRFARDEIAPTVIQYDINQEFPKDIIKKLGELGFLGMMASPEWNGSGLDAVSYVMAMEEICAVGPAVGIVMSVQNSLVNWIIENFGTEHQKEKYLKPLAAGEDIGAYCLSEPEAGSDATQQHTLCKKKGDKWILNGTKNWISTAHHADTFIVFAQSNPKIRHKGICCFIVEKDTPGFEPAEKEDKMGMRSSDTCSIGLTNVEVPEENMIGGIGDGFKYAMKSLNGGRIGIAAQSVGIARGAFELAARYAKERITFGKPIIRHQMIQAKLADMSTRISAARLLVHKAAYMKDKKVNYIRESAEAKLFASATAFDVAREAVQIHGGYGYVREYHVERFLRDAKVTEIYEGTSEIQKIVIAREIEKMFD